MVWMAGAAFLGQINNQILHQGYVGSIALKAAFLGYAQQLSMGHGL